MGSLIARIKGDLRTGSPLLACQASVHGGAAEGLQVLLWLAATPTQMAFRDDGNPWWQAAEYDEASVIRARPKG
jgi:hypothetical protein